MRKMGKRKEKRNRRAAVCSVLTACGIFLGGCGAYAADGRVLAGQPLSAQETAQCMMESMKALDLETFNAVTDNYISTEYNWIGQPVRRQYRVFNELLQPGVRIGRWKKKYEFNQALSEKIMENLTWEMISAKEDHGRAEIVMEVTNLDMNGVMGMYEMNLMEKMIAGEGTGLREMIRELSSIADEDGGLLALMESWDQDRTCTLEVTATANRRDGTWIIHLDDELLNACMGNIDAEEYPEEVRQKIRQLEAEQEEKLDEWAEDFSDSVERWVDGLFGE